MKCMYRITVALVLQIYWCQISSCTSCLRGLLLCLSKRERGVETAWFSWRVKGVNFGLCSMQPKNEKVSIWLRSTANWPACKMATPKFFPFCSPGYIFPSFSLFLPFLWKRGMALICFLYLINSWAQVRSQCSSQKQPSSPCYKTY
jgi:hypothetical protein